MAGKKKVVKNDEAPSLDYQKWVDTGFDKEVLIKYAKYLVNNPDFKVQLTQAKFDSRINAALNGWRVNMQAESVLAFAIDNNMTNIRIEWIAQRKNIQMDRRIVDKDEALKLALGADKVKAMAKVKRSVKPAEKANDKPVYKVAPPPAEKVKEALPDPSTTIDVPAEKPQQELTKREALDLLYEHFTDMTLAALRAGNRVSTTVIQNEALTKHGHHIPVATIKGFIAVVARRNKSEVIKTEAQRRKNTFESAVITKKAQLKPYLHLIDKEVAAAAAENRKFNAAALHLKIQELAGVTVSYKVISNTLTHAKDSLNRKAVKKAQQQAAKAKMEKQLSSLRPESEKPSAVLLTFEGAKPKQEKYDITSEIDALHAQANALVMAINNLKRRLAS